MLEVGDETSITPGTQVTWFVVLDIMSVLQVHKSISRASKSDYELGVAFGKISISIIFIQRICR